MDKNEFALKNLPSGKIFPLEMPRYPNLWFFIDKSLALRERYNFAIRFLMGILEKELDLKDDFVNDIQNHNLYHLLNKPREGSDFHARVHPLQQYDDPENSARSHTHQVHARFYISSLYKEGKHIQRLNKWGRDIEFFLIPASVHYEVTTEELLHPYADFCPFCGITGNYDVPVNRKSQDYCVKIHDPLGLEYLIHGKIRGNNILENDGSGAKSLQVLKDKYALSIEEYTQETAEPFRLAEVFVSLKD
ncbi:MAG: hypothetical protein GXP33_01195 [Spirochaetes bacterium]|nr:hypothetical protein [Spirochaetota bacterium]